MTNFDYLLKEPKFNSFASVAVAAEKVLHIDAESCIINCRRAMEFAIKWMYSVDEELNVPYQDTLVSLMSTEEFRDIVGEDTWKRLDFIRRMGNNAAHKGTKLNEDQAKLCLENLFYFMDFVSCCYADNYESVEYNEKLLSNTQGEIATSQTQFSEVDLQALLDENKQLKDELTARRKVQSQTFVSKPLDLSEYKTRKIYIDSMLIDAGWTEGKDWINEVELQGMPNASGVGYADYVLYDDAHKPLAVIEAKRTCVDVSKGRQQAKLYADLLEQKYKRRPVVFLTNGFDTHIIDNQYPERKVATIYSKADLNKLYNLRNMKSSLSYVRVDKDIAGRYYQEAAIKAVCESFDTRNRRKALLVMATGSGKTRTVIALTKVLLDAGWIKNVLFLADRNSLVTQAKRSFVNLLPNLSATNLCEDKDNYNAHCVFSTYQTMMNCIDSVKDENGKLFTCGHFDLVICDEAHRSIYNKYKDIFTYFDAPLVGLTATPKDEIEKNTYDIFELEQGVPTYGYDLAQAVKDGYLVDYTSIETKMKFIEEGIAYDELSEEEREDYENTFVDENGDWPESIGSSALNTWLFNEDTIKQVLYILMTEGIHIDSGSKIGKTIIFAKNHKHAEKINEIFGKEYPHLNGYTSVIDNYINYAQTAIDEFSNPKKLPQIAISVDMLDTGIDVPEVVNLVFFKKVMSKAKFWQMIGRGTRLCPGLLDGNDKEQFYIFDFCSNFDFFRVNPKGKPAANLISIQGAIFNLKFQMAYKLQDLAYQTDELKNFRKQLVDDMVNKVNQLERENFAVRQHLKYVDLYSNADNYKLLTYADTLVIRDELAPLIHAEEDDISAVRFDALMYGIELAYLIGKKNARSRTELKKKVSKVAKVGGNIPEIESKSDLIDLILNKGYMDTAGINEFEYIREELRDIMKYISHGPGVTVDTNYADDILSVDWKDSELENDDLKNYKAKVEFYIRSHQNEAAIAKLKDNIPLSKTDIVELEKILWSELGTKDEYIREYKDKPLGQLVREIVGLNINAAKEAFSEFLVDNSLNEHQIYFVNQIIEYIVQNGMMRDFTVLQGTPFTDQGNIVQLFGNDLNVWNNIKDTITKINDNAMTA